MAQNVAGTGMESLLQVQRIAIPLVHLIALREGGASLLRPGVSKY